MTTQTPEIGRRQKPGLERSAIRPEGRGFGTPAPGEGYALTIAHRECAKLTFEHPHDAEDVTVGVSIVAAKRASLIGRGPTLGDVQVALQYLGLLTSSPVTRQTTTPFLGLAHSYAAQRRFSDAVPAEALTGGDNSPALH
jgi:hypothetical protein